MPRPKSRVKKERLNLELPATTIKQLLYVQNKLRADSLTETVRRVVDLAAVIFTEYSRGGTVGLERKDGTTERIHIL